MINYLIYDCEIIKCIPDRSGKFEGYEYCEGWHDHANMGISVIGAYSRSCDHTGYVLGEDLDTFRKLLADHEYVIGFNSRNFDDRLLAANGIEVKTDYDLLEEVRIAAGWGATYDTVPQGYSYSLDAIARANGMAKTGSGALAPQLWQQGRHQEVIDYCLNDVNITHEILKLGLAGSLQDPNTGQLLQLRLLEPENGES